MSTGARSDKNAPYFQALVPGKSRVLDFTNTSARIGPFTEGTTLISVFATQDCWIQVGDDSVVAAAISSGAEGDSMFLPGGIKDFIGVEQGEYIAVVRSINNGTMHVCEGL